MWLQLLALLALQAPEVQGPPASATAEARRCDGPLGWLECYESGFLTDAFEACGRRILEAPDDTSALAMRARLLGAMQKESEASIAYARAVRACEAKERTSTELARTLRDKAMALSGQSQFLAALEAVRASLALDANDAVAWDTQAGVWMFLGRAEESLASHRRAIELAPDSAMMQIELADSLARLGRSESALQQYRAICARWPDHPHAHHQLGVQLGMMHRFAEAVAPLRRALELDPRSASAQANLGAVLMSMGSYAEAIHALERALELQPDHPQARTMLAQLRAVVPPQPVERHVDESDAGARREAEAGGVPPPRDPVRATEAAPPKPLAPELANMLALLRRGGTCSGVATERTRKRENRWEFSLELTQSDISTGQLEGRMTWTSGASGTNKIEGAAMMTAAGAVLRFRETASIVRGDAVPGSTYELRLVDDSKSGLSFRGTFAFGRRSGDVILRVK